MKKAILIIFCFYFLVILLFSYSSILYFFSANKISSEKIKMIKIGMSVNQVFQIVGKPVQIENRYLNNGKTFTYTRPINYAMEYPMLWVHFDKKGQVNCVFSKKYILFGGDDQCIYNLDVNSQQNNLDTSLIESKFN